MATVTRGPITISYDETTLQLGGPLVGGRRGGPRRIPTTGTASASPLLGQVDNAKLVAALSEHMDFVDSVSLVPVGGQSGPDGRRGPGAPTRTQTASVQVQVGADENAVVLVEQDGYYSWIGGDAARVPARRRGPAATTVRFEIELHPTKAAARRRGDRGLLKDALFRPVTALIFKFVADIAVGQLVKRLEREIKPGLVHIGGSDPAAWTKAAGPADITLPSGRRANVLLIVHGTFSSTRGGFGSLGATASGVAFLTDAVARYDAVIGFDHRTLSEDPLENAEQMLAALQAIDAGFGMDVDIVTHSRGALVARSLVEYLAPKTPGVDVRRVIMIAGPNSGTLLASSGKWDDLVDLYTNLVVAACRLVTLAAPQVALGTMILKDSLTALSILVKALVSSAVRDDGKAPGLAAMTPPGAFITEINQTQPSQPASLDYRSISSDFEVDGLRGPGEFPDRLKRLIADGLMDKLMGESNDLVVNVASMTRVDPQTPGLIREVFEFGVNDRVYHTNYFMQPEVHRALTNWLGLVPSLAHADTGGATDGGAMDLPNIVDRHFVVVDATLPVDLARVFVRQKADVDYAVIRRYHAPHKTVYHYPFRVAEFNDRFKGMPLEWTIEGSGVLSESDASPEIAPGAVTGPSQAPGRDPWSRRQVVVRDGAPIGVVRAADDPALPSAAPPPPPPPTSTPSPRRGRPDTIRPPTLGRPRRGGAAAQAPAAESETTSNETFFHAEMDDSVVVETESLVLVEATAEDIVRQTRRGAATEGAQVDPAHDIFLHLIPRANFVVVGPNHAVVSPPGPGDLRMVGFTVKATGVGPGEVAVVAMQGAIVLVKLIMTPTVVAANRPQETAVAARVSSSVAVAPPPSVGPCDQLWIEENKVIAIETNGGREQQVVVQTAYDVRYQSESLDVQVRAATKAIKGDRFSYVRQLFARIEDDWGTSAGDADTFTKSLRAYGGQLFDELIPEPIQRILWDNKDKIRTIQVNSEDPLIPWELVHLKSPGGKLPREERFLANMGLVHWLDGAAIAPRTVTVRAGRVRVLAPTYPVGSGWELQDTADEKKFLQTRFGAKSVASSVAAVLELIETPGRFDLLHFAGHGTARAEDIANAEIIVDVRDNAGDWQPVTVSSTMVEQFGALRKANGNRPIVFLNACQVGRAGYQLTGIGGFAQAFLRSGAGVFVSTLWSVGDEPARAFSEHFYSELSSGRTIAEATVSARKHSRAAGDPSWLAYVVYGRPEGTVALR